MNKPSKQISFRINEPWDFAHKTKISVLHGMIESELKDRTPIVLSKPVTYENVTFEKIVASPVNSEQVLLAHSFQITPVVQSARLQNKEIETSEFKPGSDFHRAASWRAWFLEGELIKS